MTITRFCTPEMAQLWSEQNRYDTWTRVEVLVTEAQSRLGTVPAAALHHIRSAPPPSAARVARLEAERDHEVLAFLAAYCETIPDDAARWVHLGMTSYDLVDTALGATLATASDLLLDSARALLRVLVEGALRYWDTVCIGRTHGIHAEPTTFGHKLAGFGFAIDRGIARLSTARQAVAVGTISGAVGTYSLIDPFIEQYVCRELGLGVEPVPTQVVARDRHAELVCAVATLAACVEAIALELRLLQRSEVGEVAERRKSAYQGSSAMPHKRNPTASERLCGLARVLRGHIGPFLENVALWHERDLAHAAVERLALPQVLGVAHYQLTLATDVVATLEVSPDRMRANIDHTAGTVYSSLVLARLLADGVEREHAYRLLQTAAATTDDAGNARFEEVLADQGIEVDGLDPHRFLTRHDVVLQRLKTLADTGENIS
ncbi:MULTISPECIES: adenylosuccinate lyase [Nocardia]|uniref:adenylosuccinate lyase n=1 Tax=Nocardia TaxID=1817 RepID=UPI0002DD2990|nr:MULTISPECIES: adenylosuccinate lyase [Nocardia]